MFEMIKMVEREGRIVKKELQRKKNRGKFEEVEFLEIKVITIDNSMDGLKSTLDIAEKRIVELEDGSGEITLKTTQRNTKMERIKQILREKY